MSNLKSLVIATGLLAASSSALAIPTTVTIDFHTLASGNEYGVPTLMFDINGNVTTNAASSILDITGTTGFAYLDNDPGLGVCANINSSAQCAPSSDDNVSHHDATSTTAAYDEVLHFNFDFDVAIDAIYFNNRHDGDGSLEGDSVMFNGVSTALLGTGNGFYSTFLANMGTASSFSAGYDSSQDCKYNGTGSYSANNCEFYVSKLVFT